MSEELRTKDQQFAKASRLDRKRLTAFVVDMEPREYIEIDDHRLRITVADARALRDWLNQVLNHEK
jgi:hypothetical protein